MALRLKGWREVISADFPKIEITQATIKENMMLARRGYRADMRIATGKVWTDKEYEAYRARVLATPLP